MIQYTAHNQQIIEGGKVLCRSGQILVDSHQDLAQVVKAGWREHQFVVKALPVGDYVFVAQRKVVVVEEKRPADLATSIRSRRLQRQLRQIMLAGEVSALGLRLEREWGDRQRVYGLEDEVGYEIVKWEMLGGLVLFLPPSPEQVGDALLTLQAILKPGSHQLSILAGTDGGRETSPSFPPWARALRKVVKGVGPKTLGALVERYGRESQPLIAALAAPDEEWQALGINKGVIKERRRVVENEDRK